MKAKPPAASRQLAVEYPRSRLCVIGTAIAHSANAARTVDVMASERRRDQRSDTTPAIGPMITYGNVAVINNLAIVPGDAPRSSWNTTTWASAKETIASATCPAPCNSRNRRTRADFHSGGSATGSSRRGMVATAMSIMSSLRRGSCCPPQRRHRIERCGARSSAERSIAGVTECPRRPRE